MKTIPVPADTPLADNPSVLELFVDGASITMDGAGIVHFVFTSARADEGNPPKVSRHVSGRIAMPMKAALALQSTLAKLAKELVAAGAATHRTEAPKTKQ